MPQPGIALAFDKVAILMSYTDLLNMQQFELGEPVLVSTGPPADDRPGAKAFVVAITLLTERMRT
jgi:hypothetical protein